MKYSNLIKSKSIPIHRKLPMCVRSTRAIGNVEPSANTTVLPKPDTLPLRNADMQRGGEREREKNKTKI